MEKRIWGVLAICASLLVFAGCQFFNEILDQAPTANAGADQPKAKVGVIVTLDGTKSSDPDKNALTYEWTFQSVALDSGLTNADITNANSSIAYFTPDTAGPYVVQLKVSDGFPSKDTTDTVTITAISSGPATPTGLTVGSATQTTLTISWTAVSDATSYQLFRDTSQSGSFSTKVYDNSGTSYTDTGLTSGNTYWYKVQASNDSGSSVKSTAKSGTTSSAPPPPAVPTGLTVDNATSSSLHVFWTAVSGATSYQVFRDTSQTGPFSNQVYNNSGTSFTDNTGLSSNTPYWYEVQATNANGSSAKSTPQSGTTLQAVSAPNTPTGLNVPPNNWAATSLQVQWNSSTGATSYQVFRDTSQTGSFSTQVYNSSGTSFTDSGLTAATTYYYVVQASNTGGPSALSSAVSGTTIGTILWQSGGGWSRFFTNDVSELSTTSFMDWWHGISGSSLVLGGTLETQVKKVSGNDLMDYGVVFSYINDSNFFYFVIETSGYFGIFYFSGGIYHNLIYDLSSGSYYYLSSSAILTGNNQTNDLKIHYYYSSSTLYYYADFYINETLVYYIYSGSPFLNTSGLTGFFAEAGASNSTYPDLNENFPTVPVDIYFKQIQPIQSTGSIMGDALPQASQASPQKVYAGQGSSLPGSFDVSNILPAVH
jgi:hypothetical protein